MPSPLAPKPFSPQSIARFWPRVRKTETCWFYTGLLSRAGYGRFTADGREYGAHVFAYRLLVGPVPPGMDLDHVKARGCRHRNCVNPAHLEPVTRGENLMRGDGPAAINKRKTHCIHGHEFTPENTHVRPSGHRTCHACRRVTDAAARKRRKA